MGFGFFYSYIVSQIQSETDNTFEPNGRGVGFLNITWEDRDIVQEPHQGKMFQNIKKFQIQV